MRITYSRIALAALIAACLGCSPGAAMGQQAGPDYGPSFWGHWGDGNAEVAGYSLTYPRYGELRNGTGVAVFVTEEFSDSARVKNETPGRPATDLFPVIKLNWMQDFPTGVYDYNMMTSAFATTKAVAGLPAGSAVKVVFSAQEWCGQAHARLDWSGEDVRHRLQSYFDGEGDRDDSWKAPEGETLSEDLLMHWARGLAGPVVSEGGRVEVQLLRSMEIARLRHLKMGWTAATLTREEEPETTETPAGSFETVRAEVRIPAGSVERLYPPQQGKVQVPETVWTFWVERAAPHRLIRWTRSDGFEATLLGVDRMPYWGMNANGYEEALERIGLKPRAPRTP